jgi:homoserine O-acetyltransferase
LELVCGRALGPIDVAYETYGQLSPEQDNVILVCHALSGNAHAAGFHRHTDRKPGWWDAMIGPDKPIDTNRYYVICSNFLGGCSGTTGPSSINPATGRPYGLDFPIVTIRDMVKVQKLLLDRLGIKRLLAVIGGSIGGMQALQWMIDYPDFVKAAIPIATTAHLSAQAIAFDAVGRNAILADPGFCNGQYHGHQGPDRGLAIARMIGHITYLSEEGMRQKFGRQLRAGNNYQYDFNSEFAVETYLDHQGQSFVERFDANSYLYITKAADYFDLQKDYGSLRNAFAGVKARVLIISFSSDWLFPPSQSQAMVDVLVANGKDVSYCNIESAYGHDAFLLEVKTLGPLVRCFLHATYRPEKAVVSCGPGGAATTKAYGQRVRIDYDLIESLITRGSKVLDVGCGDGELLERLRRDRSVQANGIEVDPAMVLECICKGIPVIQYDIEQGLASYSDNSFDYVILSQTLQTLRNPATVLKEMLRVGRKVVVSFPNLAYWRCRLQLALAGKAPSLQDRPSDWYDSPNLHWLSIRDFDRFCRDQDLKVEARIFLANDRVCRCRPLANLFARQAIYLVSSRWGGYGKDRTCGTIHRKAAIRGL